MDRAYEVPLYRTNAGYEIEAKVITHKACVTLFLDLLKCLKDLPFVTSKRVEELVVSRVQSFLFYFRRAYLIRKR